MDSIRMLLSLIFLLVLLDYCNCYKLMNNNNDIKVIDNKIKKRLTSMIVSVSLLSLPILTISSSPIYAIDNNIIYKSGKSPKQEDPNDPKKGTKKESSFLRCLSNCKANCQKPGGNNQHLIILLL